MLGLLVPEKRYPMHWLYGVGWLTCNASRSVTIVAIVIKTFPYCRCSSDRGRDRANDSSPYKSFRQIGVACETCCNYTRYVDNWNFPIITDFSADRMWGEQGCKHKKKVKSCNNADTPLMPFTRLLASL